MGRPPLLVGTAGKTTFVALPTGQIQARAKFRDFDGRIRLVAKHGRSRAAAERALKLELANRQTPAGGGAIAASTRVAEVARLWLEAPHGWSTGTERTYRSVVGNQVVPALGELRLRYVTTGVISRAMRVIADRHGPSAAKSSTACLSGVFRMAIEDGALSANPVRDFVDADERRQRSRPRIHSGGDVDAHRVAARERSSCLARHSRSCRLDACKRLPYRGGHCAGATARTPTAALCSTSKRAPERSTAPSSACPGKGWSCSRARRPPPAGASSPYPSSRPRSCADRPVGTGGVVFTAPLARTVRDPSNASADLRQLLDSFDCEMCAGTGFQLEPDGSVKTGPRGQRLRCDQGPWSWATSHVFRKTVASRLDEAGFTPRQVADQLGHANPSMTLDVYFGRHVVSAAAAKVLDR